MKMIAAAKYVRWPGPCILTFPGQQRFRCRTARSIASVTSPVPRLPARSRALTRNTRGRAPRCPENNRLDNDRLFPVRWGVFQFRNKFEMDFGGSDLVTARSLASLRATVACLELARGTWALSKA